MKDFFKELIDLKNNIVFLETKRLKLIPWKDDVKDAKELFSFASNDKVGKMASWKPHESVEESRGIIKEIFIPNFAFKIVLEDEEKVIGNVACERDIHRPDIRSLELGYAIDEEFWGYGYAFEASEKLIELLFLNEALDLEILSIQTNVTNVQSQRVIEKLGFAFEGLRRKSDRDYLNRLRDVKSYSMTREEYLKRL